MGGYIGEVTVRGETVIALLAILGEYRGVNLGIFRLNFCGLFPGDFNLSCSHKCHNFFSTVGITKGNVLFSS